MITPEFKNDLSKGIKLFKVFDTINSFVADYDLHENQLRDYKTKIESSKKEVATLTAKKTQVQKSIDALDEKAKDILDNANKKADALIDKATVDAGTLIIEAENKKEEILSSFAEKERSIKALNSEIQNKTNELDKINKEILDVKNKLRSVL